MTQEQLTNRLNRRRFLSNLAVAATAGGFAALSHVEDVGAQIIGNWAVFNVKDYGATGNGSSDDSNAIQNAINDALAQGGTVYFPSGNYRVTRTLEISNQKPLEIRGNGWSSKVIWNFDGHLFRWNVPAYFQTVRELWIMSNTAKSSTSTAFRFNYAAGRIIFADVLLRPNETAGGLNYSNSAGRGISCGSSTGDLSISHCYFFGIKGTAVRLGYGAEVEIVGGRLVGRHPDHFAGSIGVHLTGGMGGVYLLTSISSFDQGVRIENMGADSNREVFLTHTPLDNWIGIGRQHLRINHRMLGRLMSC